MDTPLPVILGICMLTVPGVLTAADEFTGQVEVGVREVDVQGDSTKYDQYINLDNGPRLFGLNMRFAPKNSDGYIPDLMDLQLSGLGGDPYERIAVSVKKYGAYRFQYNRNRSDYFYRDKLECSQDISLDVATCGDFHHFDFERTRDDARLDVDLGERAKVTFDFERFEKSGDSTTTADIEREEFELKQPIDEERKSAKVGFQYAWDHVTLVVSERWQDYDNDYSWFLPDFSLGMEPAEPTQLDSFLLDQPYQHDTREHAVSLRARPTDRLELSLDVQDIDLDMDIDVAERSQGLNFMGIPFMRDLRGDGDVDRSTTLITSGANFALTDRIEIGANIRHYELDQDGVISFDGTKTTTDWNIDNTAFELSAQASLTEEIHVAVGWHSERRETDFIENHFIGTTQDTTFRRDEDTDQDGFYLQASYQPSKKLRLTATAEDNSIDDPFTLASATDSRRYRLRGHYRFDSGLSLHASYRRTEYENDNSDWDSTTEQTDVRASYAFDRLTLTAGFGSIDLERDIDQLVTGGFRQDQFDIRYRADTQFWDGSADFHINDQLDLSVSARTYENDGSFDVDRDDIAIIISYTLLQNYVVKMNYRNVDYSEGNQEDFDADIWELSLQYAW